MCVCSYVVLKFNSFFANPCGILPRKCNMSLQQISMVVRLQQGVLPIYATCCSKKYSMKLRLLSRTLPNISKLEHAVLILRPNMFIAAAVKRLVPANLNAWRHRTVNVQKGANCWKLPKPKKTLEKPKKSKSLGWDLPLPKSLDVFFVFLVFFCFLVVFCFSKVFTSFQKVLAGPPFQRVWKYCFVLFFSPRLLPSVGYLKETGTNHRQSCQSALGSAVKNISKCNFKSWENCTPRGCRSVKKMISVKSLKTFR